MSEIVRKQNSEICSNDPQHPAGVMAFSGSRPIVQGGFSPAVCQQSLQRIGQIRFGTRTDKGIPVSSEYVRLISPNKVLIEHAAKIYGGTVKPCTSDRLKGQWEVITQVKELRVYAAPVPIQQWFKQHDGGGRCTKKCNTIIEERSGEPCSCPLNDPEAYRKGKKNFCKASTTIEFLLIDLPGLGSWKFETGSMVAASQLPMSVAAMQRLAMQGMFVPATLSSPMHKGFTPEGDPTTYPVPQIVVDLTMADLYKIMNTAESLTGASQVASALASIDGEIVADYDLDVDPDPVDADVSEVAPTDDASKVSAYIRGVGLEGENVVERLESIGESPITWVNQAVVRQVTGPAFLKRLQESEAAFSARSGVAEDE